MNKAVTCDETCISSIENEDCFAIQGEKIKNRSLNYYKSLLADDGLAENIAWIDVFQKPETDLDAIYFCQNHPLATYKTLEGFRKYHPLSKIFLISDNGYDYTEMANHFNCEYTHLNESIYAHYNSYKLIPHEERYTKLKKYWNIYMSILDKSYAKYLIKLEDDVAIQGIIRTNSLTGFMNGTTLHKLPDYFFTHYFRDTPNAIVPNNIYFSGSGGCIFNCDQLRKCLENTEAFDKVIQSYIACNILGGVVVDDLTISILGTVLGYKIINNPNQMEIDTEKQIKDISKMVILHQVKEYYNKQLPSELSHLAKPT
jgi:hypothetical protein